MKRLQINCQVQRAMKKFNCEPELPLFTQLCQTMDRFLKPEPFDTDPTSTDAAKQ